MNKWLTQNQMASHKERPVQVSGHLPTQHCTTPSPPNHTHNPHTHIHTDTRTHAHTHTHTHTHWQNFPQPLLCTTTSWLHWLSKQTLSISRLGPADKAKDPLAAAVGRTSVTISPLLQLSPPPPTPPNPIPSQGPTAGRCRGNLSLWAPGQSPFAPCLR